MLTSDSFYQLFQSLKPKSEAISGVAERAGRRRSRFVGLSARLQTIRGLHCFAALLALPVILMVHIHLHSARCHRSILAHAAYPGAHYPCSSHTESARPRRGDA